MSAPLEKDTASAEKSPQDTTLEPVDNPTAAQDKSSSVQDESASAQYGVRAANAVALVMSRRDLIFTYGLLWLAMSMFDLNSGVARTLNPYVTSAFQKHSLTATTGVISNVASAASQIPYAKLLDIHGRPQGIAVMVGVMTIGTLMMASCKNIGTYCAAQIFYSIGYSCIRFSITLFVADTTPLRSRAFMMGFTGSSSIITTWLYGPISDSILSGPGFRWGFGIWCIVIPVVFSPMLGALFVYEHRAIKQGRLTRNPPDGTWQQSFLRYAKDFDVIGILLVTTGLTLVLLALSLYSYQPDTWKSPMIICFFVFGGIIAISFPFYERYLAPTTFVPWYLLVNRTVISTNVMMFFWEVAGFIWNAYFFSMLIVVWRQSVTNATYINNIYFVGSTIWMLLLGVACRYYGHIKYYSLTLGIPVVMLGTGLLIKYRTEETDIRLVIMCQIIISIGSGTMYPFEQMTLMAVSPPQHVAALLAVESLLASAGKAVGSAIAAAIWTGVFPDKLAQYLPESALPDLRTIYGDIDTQSSFPDGSPERLGVTHSYADTQQIMLITSTCLYVVTFVAVLCWEDIDVKKMKKLTHVV